MRRAFWSVVLLVSAFLIVPVSPATAAPYCGIVWGSLEKSAPGLSQAPVVDVRTGQHSCYDRLVIDVAGDVGGYTVAYVPYVVQDGSGAQIPTRGGAALQITVNDPSYDSAYNPTYSPADPLELRDVTGYRTFRQVVSAGSFEGYTSVGLGVRARLPFRVFTLDGPGTSSRLVVDVAHRW
ncbi:AMIN-like domain-containing (lipo)protein [Cellulomonas sp. P5_C5]